MINGKEIKVNEMNHVNESFLKECGKLKIDSNWEEIEKYCNNVIEKTYEHCKDLVSIYESNKLLKNILPTYIMKTQSFNVDTVLYITDYDSKSVIEYAKSLEDMEDEVNSFIKDNDNFICTTDYCETDEIDGYTEDDSIVIEGGYIYKHIIVSILKDKNNFIEDDKIKKIMYPIILDLLFDNHMRNKNNSKTLSLCFDKYNYVYVSQEKLYKIMASKYTKINCGHLTLLKNGKISLEALYELLYEECKI